MSHLFIADAAAAVSHGQDESLYNLGSRRTRLLGVPCRQLKCAGGRCGRWAAASIVNRTNDRVLIARHKSENRCDRTGLRSMGGQGAMRTWGYDTNPIPSGIPCPAPC